MTTYKEHLKQLDGCPFCKRNYVEIIYEGIFHDVKVALAAYKENEIMDIRVSGEK